jgi:hypothetical protein
MAPWSPTAVSFGGSVAIPQAGSTSGPLAGSTRRAGGGGMAMAGLSRLPRWPPWALPCCITLEAGGVDSPSPADLEAIGLGESPLAGEHDGIITFEFLIRSILKFLLAVSK